MAFQFLHIDIVARSVPKKATGKRWTLAEVLAEAGRAPNACPHIEAPKAPQRVFGLPLTAVSHAALLRADGARDARGRQLRKDAPVLLAGVASYPMPVAELGDAVMEDFLAWEARTVRWLGRRFGDCLASVVRHTDEAFPHIHFFVVPDLRADLRLDLEGIHPGIGAREAAKADGKSPKEANRAYCAAMRSLQDEFHVEVGVYHGHLREGPKRKRLTRAGYLSEQRDATQRAEMMMKVEIELSEVERLKVEAAGASHAKRRAQILESENAALRTERNDLAEKAGHLRKVATDARREEKRHREAAANAADIVLNLIGFLIQGAERFRQALLVAPAPTGLHPDIWMRLRRFLTPPGGPGSRQRARGEGRE